MNKDQIANLANGPGRFDVDIVGESHYQQALEDICGGRSEDSQRLEKTAVLVLENENKFDKNAVMVTIDGLTVGYLDRETAISFREQLTKAAPGVKKISCRAVVVGGWDRGPNDRGHFGVKLDIPKD